MKIIPFIIFCIILISGLVFSTGCMSSVPAGNVTVVTRTPAAPETPTVSLQVTTLASEPVPVATPTPSPAATTPVITPAPTTTWIQKSSITEAANDPYIVILEFSKDYFRSDLPDCGMRMAFPQVANNTGYGIQEPNTRLDAYSKEQMLAFLKANAMPYTSDLMEVDPYIANYVDTNNLGGTSCMGTVTSPTWNFVRIDATIMPRNARPTNYDIGINIRSRGKVSAQLRLNRTLILDQPVIYELYVPVKTVEMDRFDSLEMVFHKNA